MREVEKSSGVVIFSPSRFSLNTICVTELLRRRGVKVHAIVVRRLFNPARFRSEFRRDGSRLLKKIWKKFVLRKRAYKSSDFETIADFMRAQKIDMSRVDEFKKQQQIPILYCKDLNDRSVVDLLENHKPEVVVFTGGGLIRDAVLENSGAGILNCHMGVLPEYRGMDVVEWPILAAEFDQVGITVHFMDKGVDTGEILKVKRIPLDKDENFKQLRNRFEPIMCRELVEVCADYLDGKLTRKPQKVADGKQYFIMHPRLIELAELQLKRACKTN